VNILDLIADCGDLHEIWPSVGGVCLQLAAIITENEFPSIKSLVKHTKKCPHVIEKNIKDTDISEEIMKVTQISVLVCIGFQVDQETVIEHILPKTKNITSSYQKRLINFMVTHIVCSKYHVCFDLDNLAQSIVDFAKLYESEPIANVLSAITSNTTYALIAHTIQKAHVLNLVEKIGLSEERINPFLDLIKAKCDCDGWKRTINFPKREVKLKKITILSMDAFLTKIGTSLKVIGTGTYGSVFRVKMSDRQQNSLPRVFIGAYKVPKNDTDNDSLTDAFCLREINALLKISHPNVVPLEYIVVGDEGISFVMECMSYTLTTYIYEFYVEPIKKFDLVIQFLEGLIAIHNSGYVHRDLSIANILIKISNTNKKQPILKIADFGLSRNLRKNILDRTQITGYVCSLYYRAPEILLGTLFPSESANKSKLAPYTEKIDIWSAACVIYYIFTKMHLFPCDKSNDMPSYIYSVVGQTENGSKFETLNNFSSIKLKPNKLAALFDLYPQLSHVIRSMLSYDPELRPSAEDVLSQIKTIRDKIFA
jgi:hypothetical protein